MRVRELVNPSSAEVPILSVPVVDLNGYDKLLEEGRVVA